MKYQKTKAGKSATIRKRGADQAEKKLLLRIKFIIKKGSSNMQLYGEYFCGNKISEYGIENGYLDYATLAKAFDAVLCNSIAEVYGWQWEQESGFIDNSEEIEELENEIEELENEIEELENEIEEFEEEQNSLSSENVPKWAKLEMKIKENKMLIEEKQEQIEELQREMDDYPEIFQYWLVSDGGAEILKEINEIVFYIEELDLYVWGVTHYGTSWNYVLTDVPCNTEKFSE